MVSESNALEAGRGVLQQDQKKQNCYAYNSRKDTVTAAS